MSTFRWEFVFNHYELFSIPNVDATVMLRRPLVWGRRVDEWDLRMAFFIEQTGKFEELRKCYNTREEAMRAAEECILRYKLEGKI